MSRSNTATRYGSVAKTFHWLTALLILTALLLGFVAYRAPYEDSAQLAFKATLFSLHKTIGLTAFLVAVLRILWAFTQPRPKLLNGDHRLEALAAETAHWVLYGAMVLVPLTGWMHHAATTGFAPIWWPFGQSLFFIPKDPTLAETLGTLHYVFMLLLVLSLLAHIGGALKHAIVDKDKTLQRMLPGRPDLPEAPAKQPGHALPFLGAVTVWAAALYIGAFSGIFAPSHAAEPVAELAEVSSEWQVQSGTLGIAVQQFGSEVSGEFADWTAEIAFDETATDGKHGTVTVTIAIGSLTLGSVTDQALGADYLNASANPTATFTADLLAAETGYIAEGTLALNGNEVATSLPFELTLEGDSAEMTGALELDRRSFHVGDTMTDESSLGFGVAVRVNLTATRGE
ncbi:cytochrome b/b6 domain-containing protein [Shimia sp. MMG029]|uniref:cytochrome b/b6 domain-containing protein n=1 Tax=Shimia sp. MMG029 TaxID=3021978 RepID=UPI0022FE475F|nr:cytochrome b/b6 domain-containing protein [Shimia sp. MMG029]MDA5555610.1 cytochrome b/b6 domain-containing protein [Shimia sp. MMG029]